MRTASSVCIHLRTSCEAHGNYLNRLYDSPFVLVIQIRFGDGFYLRFHADLLI
jgi:hypothetical protein